MKGIVRSFKAPKRIGNVMRESLVIDDQNSILSILHVFLVQLGYEVKIAHNEKRE